MLNLLQRDIDGSPDFAATARCLQLRFPGLCIDNLPHLVAITTQVAKLILGTPETKRMPQHLWLFELAGRLKGALPDDLRGNADVGTRLAPLALLLVEVLQDTNGLPGRMKKPRIRWDDPEAIMLEFEEIWYKRKFPKGSPYLEEAAAFAARNPLQLQGNTYFVRLLNVAYYLQSKQPGLPILLPISDQLARLLHTTPVTLGTAIGKAVREGYLEIVDATYSVKSGKARSFKVNMGHPAFKDRPLSLK